MSKRLFIYSTLSADNIYAAYVAGGADLPMVERQVLIRGGANVPDKRLVTPRGVVTEVTEDDYEHVLKPNHVFNLHVDNGFIQVSKTRSDPEVAAADMTSRDEASPLVPEDFEADSAKPVGFTEPEAQLAAPPAAVAPAHPAAAARRQRA